MSQQVWKNLQTTKFVINERVYLTIYLDYVNHYKLQQDHPCVIHLIQTSYLRKPTPLSLAYNLSKPEFTNPSDGQSQAILRLLNNQVNS
jgi:hypothetical protein